MSGHTISLSTTGTVVVAAQSVTGPYLNLTGTLTGNVTLDFGPGAGFWLVSVPAALSLAGHTLTFGSGSGTVTPIAVGNVYTVLTFGGNTIAATAVATGGTLTSGSVTGTGFWTSASGTLNGAALAFPTGTGFWTGTAGVLDAASLAFPLLPAKGGTGLATLTAHAVILGEGTGNVAFAAPGTSGLPLLSAGASVDPAFTALTLSGAGVTGQLGVGNGGTGTNTLAAHTVLVGAGAATINTAGPGTALAPLISGGGGADPSFTALTLSSAVAVTGVLPTANGGTGLSSTGVTQQASNDTGASVALTNANFTMIRAVTFTVTSGQFALCYGGIEYTGTAGTGCLYAIGVDSTTTPTSPQHNVVNQSVGVGTACASIFYKSASLSAGSHTFNLIGESSAFSISDVATGSLLVQIVNS